MGKKSKTKLWSSASIVDGNKSRMNLFRAEGFGSLALLSVVQILDRHFDLSEHSVELWLDCETLIKKVKASVEDSIKFIEEKEMDVIFEIRAIIKAF